MAQNFFVDEPKKKEDVPNFFIDIPSTSINKESATISNKGNEIVAKPPTEDPTSSAERESFLSKAYNTATKPLVDLRGNPTIHKATEAFTQEHPYIGKPLNFISDVLSGTSSPLDLLTGGMGGAEALAGKAGLEGIANALKLGTKALSGGVVGHGGYQLATGDTPEKKVSGALEVLGGLLGLKNRGKLPEIADSAVGKGIDINELPPDLVPVGSEGIHRLEFPNAKNPEDTIFNAASEKFGMGIPTKSDVKIPEVMGIEPSLKERIASGEKIPDFNTTNKNGSFWIDNLYGKGAGGYGTDKELAFINDTRRMRGQPPFTKPETKPKLRINQDGTFTNLTTGEILNKIGKPPSDLLPLEAPRNIFPQFNKPGTKSGMTGLGKSTAKFLALQENGEPLFNIEGGPKDKSTVSANTLKEMGIKVPEVPKDAKPVKGSELRESLKGNKPPNEPPISTELPEKPDHEPLGDVVDKKRKSTAEEILNLPRGIMASYDLSAPGRQGLPLIWHPAWWKSWVGMVKSMGSEGAFRDVQDSIANKPLFKDYGQGSFAKKAGLHLTDLTDLSHREEAIMSTWAEKIPGVRPSNRAYTAYLNKLRADVFEDLISKAKILNPSGEFDMPRAQQIAKFVNTATGRGDLGKLEKYATELNSALFSPRLIASRLTMLNPMYYWAADPFVRRQAIKSLFAVAGAGALVGQLGKLGGGTVETNPTNSDFGKLKIGNTRIDPFAGFQQYVVLASRLLENKTTSSSSGKEIELGKKYGSPTRKDILENFGVSKLNPALSLAYGILKGKNIAGQPYNIPEEIAQRFVPLFLQDLKTVATENPNLIPGYSDLGLEDFDAKRMMLAIPGGFGASIQNYPSR